MNSSLLDHKRIDAMQYAFQDAPQADCPLTHRFTPGMYCRELLMPAGTLVVSRQHKTEHPYVVLSGRAMVSVPGEGVKVLEAGHVGITKPGTRRALYILEDCRWITFHPTKETNLAALQEELTYTPDVSYIEGDAEAREMIEDLRGAVAFIQDEVEA